MKTLTRDLLYGSLALPIAFLGLPLYIYLPTFYVTNIELNVASVGFTLFLARALDMLLDPFIGRLSDTSFDKKKLLILGALCLLIGFYFLTHPPLHASTLWLFSFSMLTYLGWSLVNIPYLSFNALLGKNYHDNTRLSFARELSTIIGVVIALFLPFILEVAQDAKKSLELLCFTIILLTPFTLLAFVFFLKPPTTSQKALSLKESFFKFYHDFKESKKIFLAFIINNLANAIPATLFLFFVQLVLKEPDATGALLLLYFLSGVCALPLWLWLCKHFLKEQVWVASMALASVVFCFVPLLEEGDVLYFSIICVLSGMSLGADMALPSSMQADLAQRSKALGNEVNGTLFGFWAMFTKFALALSVGITFVALEFAGFDAKAPTTSALEVLCVLYALVPVALKAFCIALVLSYRSIQVDKVT